MAVNEFHRGHRWLPFSLVHGQYSLFAVFVCMGMSFPGGSLAELVKLSKDFSMDWSLLEPGSRYPLLRKELVYSNHVFVSFSNFYFFKTKVVPLGLLYCSSEYTAASDGEYAHVFPDSQHYIEIFMDHIYSSA